MAQKRHKYSKNEHIIIIIMLNVNQLITNDRKSRILFYWMDFSYR